MATPRMDPAPLPEVRAGDNVYLMSGRLLGTVAFSDARKFKVDAPHGVLWLQKEAVFTSGHGKVTLVCEAPGLHAYQG